jgi:hypothetical protein
MWPAKQAMGRSDHGETYDALRQTTRSSIGVAKLLAPLRRVPNPIGPLGAANANSFFAFKSLS